MPYCFTTKDIALDVANSMMADESAKDVSTDALNIIIDALQPVQEFPGILEKMKEVKTFMTSKCKTLAGNDIVAMMNRPSDEKVDIYKLKHAMQHCGAWTPQMLDGLDKLLHRNITDLIAKAMCMSGPTGVVSDPQSISFRTESKSTSLREEWCCSICSSTI